MKRGTLFALIAIIFLTIFLRALPFFQHVFWGMDEGEYLRMTENILRTGTISSEYNGWTVAYPYFQGYFVLSAAFSSLSSLSALASLGAVIIFSILAPISVFLMVSKIMGESAGIWASGFIAVAAPYAYHTSLPAPESLGQAMLILTILILWRDGEKTLFPALFMATAMLVSHPLSGYMLLLFTGTSVAMRIFRGDDWKKRWVFLAIYSTILMIYWMFVGEGFRKGVLISSGVSPVLVVFLTYLALFSLYMLGKASKGRRLVGYRESPGEISLPVPALMSALAASILILSMTFGIPGLKSALDPSAALFYLPFLGLIMVSFWGTYPIKASRRGLEVLGWLMALTLSALAGYFINAHLLIPYRHLEFLMIPIAVLFGAAAYILTSGRGKENRFAGFLVVLLLINAFIVYPPSQYMGGFSESTDWEEIPSIVVASGFDGLIATDHRLSTDIFALGKEEVSWEDAGDFFRNPDNSTYAPNYVLLTEKMKKGAAFGSGNPAERIDETPFFACYLIYRDSFSSIYLWC